MHRIEVAFSGKGLDSAAKTVSESVKEDLGILNAGECRTSELYIITTSSKAVELDIEQIARHTLIDPLVQQFSINKPLFPEYPLRIEVRYHNDVTDNVGIVAKEAIEDYTGRKFYGTIRTAKRYYFSGKLPKAEAERIARELLANETIETFAIGDKDG